MLKRQTYALMTLVLLITNFGCTTVNKFGALEKVSSVDLNQFMGDWFVIANIPTFVEKGAHNALENYKLKENGDIAITFTFNKDSLDGPKKTLTMTGKIIPGHNNAEWTVSPFWPLKFPYYIVEHKPDEWVVVATPNRSYLWIMARKPMMDAGLLSEIIERMVARGFDRNLIQKIPHSSI